MFKKGDLVCLVDRIGGWQDTFGVIMKVHGKQSFVTDGYYTVAWAGYKGVYDCCDEDISLICAGFIDLWNASHG